MYLWKSKQQYINEEEYTQYNKPLADAARMKREVNSNVRVPAYILLYLLCSQLEGWPFKYIRFVKKDGSLMTIVIPSSFEMLCQATTFCCFHGNFSDLLLLLLYNLSLVVVVVH